MKKNHKQNLIAAALGCALGAMTAVAQSEPGFHGPSTLAPAEAGSSGSGGTEEDEKAQKAELAKKLQNPVANLVSVPSRTTGISASARPTP